MKFAKYFFILFLSLASASVGLAQDLLKISPKQTVIKLENDRVRVYEMTLKPGEKTPMHSHADFHVAYVLTPGKFRIVTREGKATDFDLTAGLTVWAAPETHTNENIGQTEIKLLITEFKKN